MSKICIFSKKNNTTNKSSNPYPPVNVIFCISEEIIQDKEELDVGEKLKEYEQEGVNDDVAETVEINDNVAELEGTTDTVAETEETTDNGDMQVRP